MARLILASSSPRRRELLAARGLRFEVRCPQVRESASAADVRRLPAFNAALKADAVSALCPEAMVIGADTAVLIDGVALGKPSSLPDARRMLMRLSGRKHEVVTAVSLRRASDRWSSDFEAETRVYFKAFGADIADLYLKLVPVLDKAGAYAIQEHGDMLVAKVDGAVDNVMGLPCDALLSRLAEAGIRPDCEV